jgi:hypothetical protein
MVWPFEKKKSRSLSDEEKGELAHALADLLEIQLVMVSPEEMESKTGGPKRKAIGYVYGLLMPHCGPKASTWPIPRLGYPLHST